MIRRLLLTAAMALCVAGCPDGTSSAGPAATCEKVGQQCKLGGGQLGVCSIQEAGELECTPQH